MRAGARASLVGAFVVLLILGSFATEDTRPDSPTTFGTVPGGYRALFDLLTELGFPVTRAYDVPDAGTPAATRWWVDARKLCAPEAEPWTGADWVRDGGGTAVVFLPWAPREAKCRLTDDVVIPDRVPAGEVWRLDVGGAEGPVQTLHVTLDVTRTLETPTLLAFGSPGDWVRRAGVDRWPFVLERRLGRGTLVLVADALFLRNAWLDRADAAPLAVDLVRAYGVPVFDEPELGPHVRRSAATYLLTSPALGVFLGLAATGLLFAWQGALVPVRQVTEVDAGAPRLEAFVDAIAALYARTGDHARVLERYRALTAGRLRRHLGLAPDTPVGALAERLARDPRLDRRALRLLADGEAPADERALRDAARELDGLVRAVVT
jgi:uncharacterized protein DUF4350